jgi:hypothetical protein
VNRLPVPKTTASTPRRRIFLPFRLKRCAAGGVLSHTQRQVFRRSAEGLLLQNAAAAAPRYSRRGGDAQVVYRRNPFARRNVRINSKLIFPVSVFVTIVRTSPSVIGASRWPLGTGPHVSNEQLQHLRVDRLPILGEVNCPHADKLACRTPIIQLQRPHCHWVQENCLTSFPDVVILQVI